MDFDLQTLNGLAHQLETGAITGRKLLEACLEEIFDAAGEGDRAFVTVDVEAARTGADYHDRMRARSYKASAFAGIPICVKDNMDVMGQVTTAGSTVLKSVMPASRDATVIARLRAAGFVVIGRTNMTEFAFSGLGLNPHYGTPLNPLDSAAHRIPGGSSSGAAVAVATSMAHAALGTDTGGSCRIPAAFCGIVGMKPTNGRIPMDGIFPLSTTLDCVGPLVRTVSCAQAIDAVIADEPVDSNSPARLHGLRIAVPQNFLTEGLEPYVTEVFERSLAKLEKQGAIIEQVPFEGLDLIKAINEKGGFAAAESLASLEDMLLASREQFDPRVSTRIERGREQSAVDYLRIQRLRRELRERCFAEIEKFDMAISVTVPMVAPLLDPLIGDDELYGKTNLLALRNPSIANLLGVPAISIPTFEHDGLPVGLSLMGFPNGDRRLLSIAETVEQAMANARP
jgi:aspartyl-tRNA(Asn)/glutamyl-tRNA(Gln) amidotransferase subunit A